MNSSSPSRHSRTSEVAVVGPRQSDHLVHLIDIPPLPKTAYNHQRRQRSPVSFMNPTVSAHLTLTVNQAPNAALRAQRSKDSLQSDQYSCTLNGKDHQGTSDGAVSPGGWNASAPQRPQSYIIDLVTMTSYPSKLRLTSLGNPTSDTSGTPTYSNLVY